MISDIISKMSNIEITKNVSDHQSNHLNLYNSVRCARNEPNVILIELSEIELPASAQSINAKIF